jgi:site-specific DNA recombinase
MLEKSSLIWYYKCRTKGCCNNKSAQDLHYTFREILSYFRVEKEFAPLIREQMKLTVSKLTKEVQENKQKVKEGHQEIERKLERLEERYITEEINHDLYLKYAEKFKQEKVGLLKELQKLESECSNHDELINETIENASNLPAMWASGTYNDRIRIQNWLFPLGLQYNKKKNTVRTEKINQAIPLDCPPTAGFRAKKNRHTRDKSHV